MKFLWSPERVNTWLLHRRADLPLDYLGQMLPQDTRGENAWDVSKKSGLEGFKRVGGNMKHENGHLWHLI